MFNNYTLIAVSKSGVVVARGYEEVNDNFSTHAREMMAISNHVILMRNDSVVVEYKKGDSPLYKKTEIREMMKEEAIRKLTEREVKKIERLRYKAL